MKDAKHFYLDTGYLFSYLYQLNKQKLQNLEIDPEGARVARSVVSYLTVEKVKIPVFALGEAVAKLVEKKVNIGILDLNISAGIAWLNRDWVDIFIRALDNLVRKDPLLDMMDGLIVSLAIADPSCCGLLTFDSKLVNNKAIYEVNKKLYGGKRKFIVTHDPR